ncbi:phage/plasmid primase, P4 family [Peribacillus muralis]|uniref:phage/plasmid primase, P4 family n=1 Tax=Peribacillus muralis TaxID=264697 RepID=UPI0037F2DB0A
MNQKKFNFSNIPEELKQTNQWVLWKSEERNGKKTKVPYQANGNMAQSNNRRTWSTFHSVVNTYINGNYDGIGFMFSKDDPFVGVDLDNCVIDGECSDLAEEITEMMDSYTEFSPSGEGIHIIVKGDLPIEKGTGKKSTAHNLEVYRHGRYFTFTGNSTNIPDIVERTDELGLMFKKYFSDEEKKVKTLRKSTKNSIENLSNKELWEKMFRSKNGPSIRALFNGELINGDHSASDLAISNHLAFWTDKDATKMDSMFRESSLIREKWDKQHSSEGSTYGEMTIGNAIRSTHNTVADFEPKSYKIDISQYQGLSAQEENMPSFMRSDLGNAERLVYRYGNNIRYNNPFNKWYLWNEKQWIEDNTNQIRILAKHTVRNIYKEALKEEDDAARAALSKHAIQSEARSRIESMISLAEAEVPIIPEDLDKDIMLFNCNNGVINLKTGEFLEHNRDFYMNKISPIDYYSEAKCPLWEKFLEDIMQDAEGNVKYDLIEFLQKAIGYSLTGETKEHALFVLYGNGRNGKSTFLDTIRQLFGDYGTQANSESFTLKKTDSVRSDLATLKGSRLVVSSESEEGAKLAESLVKQLTGGDAIQARFLYGNPFVYTPQFKIFLMTNHKPIIQNNDEGIWRRIRLIPFTVTIPKEKIDYDLPDKLLAQEMPGILRWAVEGCLKWQKEGLGNPKEVQNATSSYRNEMDTIGNFLNENCLEHASAKSYSKELYRQYEYWCDDTGEECLQKVRFYKKIEERGYKKKKDNRGYFFQGIGINYSNTINSFSTNEKKKI